MTAQFAPASLEINPEVLPQLAHRTLIIGDIDRWRAAGRDTGAFAHFRYTSLAGINDELLREFDPEIVFSPLFGDAFDVFEVALKLSKLGFTGRYRALCVDVPDIDIIREDIAQIAPDLDFDLLQVPST